MSDMLGQEFDGTGSAVEAKAGAENEPGRLDQKGKIAFIQDYIDGKIYTSDMAGQDTQFVFMPLLCMKEIPTKNLRMVYAHMEKDDRSTMSINGHPFFSSCRLLHFDDWKEMLPDIREGCAARDKARRDLEAKYADNQG